MGFRMKKYIGLFIVILVFAAAEISTAQVKYAYNNNKLEKKVIANYVMALMSDNAGLRNSAIKIVSENKLDEVVDALIYVLKNDNSESSKVMAAVTLYQIGNPRGTNAVYNSELWNESKFMDKINSTLLISNPEN